LRGSGKGAVVGRLFAKRGRSPAMGRGPILARRVDYRPPRSRGDPGAVELGGPSSTDRVPRSALALRLLGDIAISNVETAGTSTGAQRRCSASTGFRCPHGPEELGQAWGDRAHAVVRRDGCRDARAINAEGRGGSGSRAPGRRPEPDGPIGARAMGGALKLPVDKNLTGVEGDGPVPTRAGGGGPSVSSEEARATIARGGGG